jgi:hypothetical protein
MKLTVNDKEIALPTGSTISIERTSPFNHDDTGSYSFPFPVPTSPNQQNLNWPGKLQRVGDVEEQTFILEDGGIQLLRGEVDYDEISREEIGMILQSGNTEFMKKVEGKNLPDIDFGSEWWPAHVVDVVATPTMTLEQKFQVEWHETNLTDNGKYVVSTFVVTNSEGGTYGVGCTPLSLGIIIYHDLSGEGFLVSFQFKIRFIVNTIFESAGYTIVENALETSLFSELVMFSTIIRIKITPGEDPLTYNVDPSFDDNLLHYKVLLPDMAITDFLQAVKNLLCLMFEVDELKKEVKIKFKKEIFLAENLESLAIKELEGWSHSEVKAKKGFVLRYQDQDDELATYTEWPSSIFVDTVSVLPEPTTENKIVSLRTNGRLYITVTNDSEALEWKEVGRLREYKVSNGENSIEIGVKVPAQYEFLYQGVTIECPDLLSITVDKKYPFTPITTLYFSIYQGWQTISGKGLAYTSGEAATFDGTITNRANLTPIFLYNNVYEGFINWQSSRARGFTKCIELKLVELTSLQWGKRYVISGIPIILDVVNYELPYKGVVEIKGFTG